MAALPTYVMAAPPAVAVPAIAAPPAGPERVVHPPNGDYIDDKSRQPPVYVSLRPVAAPSALGLVSYASSTFIVAAWLAGWYGDDTTALYFWPFIFLFGGLGQFLSSMWSFVARDNLGTVIHAAWGTFWIALAVDFALMAGKVLPAIGRYDYNPALAIWLVTLAFITYMCAIVALPRDFVLVATLIVLATGSVLGAIGFFAALEIIIKIAAYFWVVSVGLALWRVFSFLLTEAWPETFTPGQRDLLPRFSTFPGGARVMAPGLTEMFQRGFKYPKYEPGVIKGQ